jgi:preprotein translocase subunit SecE
MVRSKRRARARKDIETPLNAEMQTTEEAPVVEKAIAKPKEEPKAKPKAQPAAKPASKTGVAGKQMGSFLKDVRAEMKKVNWPDRERTVQSTGVVLFTLFALAACMAIFTMIFTRIAEYLFS